MVETKSQVPLLEPVTIIVAAGATRTISFPDEFLGEVVAILISNLDAANAATYQIGGDARATLTLGASQFRTIDDTKIKLLTVTAGAAGVVQIEAQIQKLVK